MNTQTRTPPSSKRTDKSTDNLFAPQAPPWRAPQQTAPQQTAPQQTAPSDLPPSAKWRSPPPLITSPPPLEPPSRLELGQLGEQVCARYLEAEGYELEALNWRGRSGELDLVARQGSTLVVIEVRTTRGDWLERPAEAVTLTKRRQVARCADEYLRSRPQLAPPVEVIRFDVVGVRVTPPWSQPEVSFDHEEGAFESPWAF